MVLLKAIIQLGGAVASLVIASFFVRIYSFAAESWLLLLRHRLYLPREDTGLSLACVWMRNYWWVILLCAGAAGVAGGFAIVRRAEITLSLVCEIAWVLALALICATLAYWQLNLLPIIHL